MELAEGDELYLETSSGFRFGQTNESGSTVSFIFDEQYGDSGFSDKNPAEVDCEYGCACVLLRDPAGGRWGGRGRGGAGGVVTPL